MSPTRSATTPVSATPVSATPVSATPSCSSAASSMDALHALQDLATRDHAFAMAMRQSGSTQQASALARKRGISISPETLWLNRGRHGLPTWRS